MLISFKASTADGCTSPLGFDPAENISKRSMAEFLRMPSAIWERQEFPVHRIRILGLITLCLKYFIIDEKKRNKGEKPNPYIASNFYTRGWFMF